MFLCFVGACQHFFLLARFLKNIRMFFKLLMFFFAYRQSLSANSGHNARNFCIQPSFKLQYGMERMGGVQPRKGFE
jgi:hypothetical protein